MHPIQKTANTYLRKQKQLKTVYYNVKHQSSKSEVKKEDKSEVKKEDKSEVKKEDKPKVRSNSEKALAKAKVQLEASKIRHK